MVCSRGIIVLMCLFVIQQSFSQPWVTINPDSLTSIDFPVKPDSSIINGKQWFIAYDTGCEYTFVKTTVRDSDSNFNYRSLAYSMYFDRLSKEEKASIIKDEDYELNGLTGRYFYYKKAERDVPPMWAAAKIFYFNGTLYAFTCTWPDSGSMPAVAEIFFGSFKINTNTKAGLADADGGDLYTKFRFGHLVFSAVFAVIAFALYLIWKKRGSSGNVQKWI